MIQPKQMCSLVFLASVLAHLTHCDVFGASASINYLADEQKFSEFGKMLEHRGNPDEDGFEPTNYELDSFTTSLIMLRNQLAMFAGKMGREAFETKIRGVAADMYLHLMEALVPDLNRKHGPNFIITTILNGASSLLRWSEQTIKLEMPDNQQLSSRLQDSHTIVKQLSTRLMSGESFTSVEREALEKAVEQIDTIQNELRKPNQFKLSDLCQQVASRVSEILSKIVRDSDANDNNPLDSITKQVNVIGDLLTITWDRRDPFKRLVKTMLLGLVRTQVPKLKQLSNFIEEVARQTHERLSKAQGFPEDMLYLFE